MKTPAMDPVALEDCAAEYDFKYGAKEAAPAPRRRFNHAYLRALAAKERRAYLRLPVVTIRCRDFRAGLAALLAAFPDGHQ